MTNDFAACDLLSSERLAFHGGGGFPPASPPVESEGPGGGLRAELAQLPASGKGLLGGKFNLSSACQARLRS